MDLKKTKNKKDKIKFVLIFFLLYSFFISCTDTDSKSSTLEVNYVNGMALSVSIKEKDRKDYAVYLKEEKETPVLGSFNYDDSEIRFRPIVPFSPGLTYEVRYKNQVLGEFKIRELAIEKKPSIVKIYPTIDSVPQNLLKLYIVFSEPMQATGKSLDFIEVWDRSENEKTELFLELENELWDKDHKMLTLWLDPGRIKQDLIPNREKGIPLTKGHKYDIIISNNWKSSLGIDLDSIYTKRLVVMEKDTLKPDIDSWRLNIPKANTLEPLKIEFNEVLDAQLALETLIVKNQKDETIEGRFSLLNKEKGILFKPSKIWTSGNYVLDLQSRLEDLAGNNLNRLFDTDLSSVSTDSFVEADQRELTFVIK